MGPCGWLVGFLSIVLAIISITWGRQNYHQVCESDLDCDHSRTQLRCLKHGGRQICECRSFHKYIKSRDKCVIKPQGPCLITQECVSGAFCDTSEYGPNSDQGICNCSPGFVENSEECDSGTVPVSSIIEPGVKCRHHEDCDSQRTHLKCLVVPKTKNKVCSCGTTGTFDSQQCRSKVGALCELESKENPYPQLCLKELSCKYDKNAYNEPSQVGTCCSKDDEGCEEFPEPPKIDKKLYGMECTSPEDCNPQRTFLRCLRIAGAKGGSICDCGSNNKFEAEEGQCVLGVGNPCNLPTYSRREPQKCIKNAYCEPDKRSDGKELRHGTCTCRNGADDECSEFDKNPSYAERASSAGQSSWKCPRIFVTYLATCWFPLAIQMSVVVFTHVLF